MEYFMSKKLADHLENVIPFETETQHPDQTEDLISVELPYEPLDRLISEYFSAKSVEQDTGSLDFVQDLSRSSEELAFSILTKSSVEPRQILQKLNIFENELAIELESCPDLNGKYLVMFAGLKADVIRLISRVDAF